MSEILSEVEHAVEGIFHSAEESTAEEAPAEAVTVDEQAYRQSARRPGE